MKDPEFPDDMCVATLRSTVATLLRERPMPQLLCDTIVTALYRIERATSSGNWTEGAAHAGTIASAALVLMLDMMSRMPPKGKA